VNRIALMTTIAGLVALLAAKAIPTHAAPAPGACAVMTKAEVKPFITNIMFDRLPAEEQKEGGGSTCNYAGVYIQLDVIALASLDNMRRQPGQTFEAVPGIGDAAYVRDNRGNFAELFAKVGQQSFTLQMDINAPQENFAQVRPRLIGLGKAFAAKLR